MPAKVDCESEVKINPPVSEKRLSLKVNEGCRHCLPFCLEALANKNPSSRYGTTYRIIFSQLTSFQEKGGLGEVSSAKYAGPKADPDADLQLAYRFSGC